MSAAEVALDVRVVTCVPFLVHLLFERAPYYFHVLTQGATMADDFTNDVTTVGTLALGGLSTGNIETGGDADWFKVSLTVGTTYQFELLGAKSGGGTLGGTAESNLSLFMLDANGASGGSSARTNSAVGDPVLTVTPLASGTYYLQVFNNSFPSNVTGTYPLRASLPEFQRNFIAGTAGNDILTATSWEDVIAGGAGVDVVKFAGLRAEYKIAPASGSGPMSVTREFGDALWDIERIEFDDAGLAYDIIGNAGKVLRSITVLHESRSTAPDFIRKGLALLDSGVSYADYMQQNLNAFVGADATSEKIVTFLYTNVVHQAPPAQAMAFYKAILDDHIWTAGQLATYAADHSINILLSGYSGFRGGLLYSLE